MTMWVVREGDEGQTESKALAENIATMGYRDMPDPAGFEDRDSMRDWYRQHYPDLPYGKIISEVTQIWDFARNMQHGDFVILPCKKQPVVWIGQVSGPYRFDRTGSDRHVRPVKWLNKIPRSSFDTQLSKSLDQHRTIYRLKKETEDAIKALLDREERLSQLHRELVLTYAKVAKKVADGLISCPHIKFEHEIESKEALKSSLKDFLREPTAEKFQSFWNTNYIWAATMGGNATNLIKKDGLDKITEVLKQIDSATEYDPKWEKQLGTSGALAEFWGKLKDRPIRNGCANHALVFFMYRSARSYSDFLLEFKRFQAFYQSLIGQEKVTPFPVEIELDQLFNFVDKATDTDLVENPQIIDNDVKTLYAIKKRIEEVLHPPDVAPVLTPVYWIEKRNLKKYPYLESTEYALGKAILSGQTSAPDVQGRVKDIRKAMREVKPGDVIFHLINSKCFSGISVASSAVDDTFLWPEEDKPPSRPAYLVRLQNYTELEPPVYKSEFLGNDHVFERLVEISERYAGRQNYPGGLFYDTKNRKIGQGGYLTRAPPEVVDILNEIYKQKSDHHLPHVPPIEHRSWIFQAVPERYNLVEHLPSLGDEPWAANKHQDFMHVGDTIYYWQAGKEAGVYGVGTIVSPLQKGLDTEFGEWSVMTRIGRFLGRRYIPKQAFIDDPVLRHSAIITSPQGTNFLLSSEEADAIKQHMPPPLLPTNEIFYGPPGTGKTYNVINRALELVHDDPDYCKYSQKTRSQLVEEFNLLQKKGQIEFITFHQSYSYEEFVEGIRPVLDSDEKVGGLDYRLKTGVFRNIAERARAADSQNKHFVLVIDEINRGNIPKIFGELITLVEEDKREGCENAISARLPYSGDPFIVPRNLHIIGTMNSADRSIALMDLALRRRFKFIPFGPVYDKTGLNDVNIDGLNLGMLLRRLNVNIQALIDKDHQIGHSFFIKIKDATDKRQKLCDVWYNEIIRLLEEYFYNDYERLSQLLDKYNDKAQTGFIESANLEIKAFLKRNNLDVSDYSTGDVHHYDGPDELIKALISYAKQQSPNV